MEINVRVKSELIVKEAEDETEKTRAELDKSDPDDGRGFGSLLKAGKVLPVKPQVERLEDRR